MFRDVADDQVRSLWLIHQDGLIDIFIGVVILGFALDILLDTSYWFISLALVGYFIVLMSGKETVTKPRLHHFIISPDQRSRLARGITAGIIWLIVSTIIWVIISVMLSAGLVVWTEFLQTYMWLFMAWILAIGLSLFAFFDIGGKRYFTYALLILLGSTLRQIFIVPALPFLFFSSAMLVIPGLYLLIRFLMSYPKAESLN